MNIGDLLIKASALSCLIAMVASFRWAGGRTASRKTFRIAYHSLAVALALASLLLLVAILTHDFSYSYVNGYSSRDLPLIYLISAFWAGQEGTYLLWALLAALFGYPLMRRTSWEPATVMAFYTPTIGFILLLMLGPGGNPFHRITPAPPDGRGLNPLLQDPWMASHPPMVFVGYAAMTIPAVLALAALVRNRREDWLRPALPWSLLSFLFLGVGIILGGFWAYKVLGWGGYWGWDPVENASLIPWLVVTALLHGILIQKASGGAFRHTNFALALAGYLLVLYGTFLTRSGVLADFSVHSFPAENVYRLLAGILLFGLGTCGYYFFRYRGAPGPSIPMKLTWSPVFALSIVLLAGSAILVLVGTSWPLLSSLAGRPASLRPEFYNRANLPVYIFLLGLLAVAPFLAWTARPRGWLRIRLLPSLLTGGAAIGLAATLGGRGVGSLLLFFVAVAALVSNLIRFFTVARIRLLNTGAAVAHCGFALMFIGIVASSAWGTGDTVSLPQGEAVSLLDHRVTFQGHVPGSQPKDRWRLEVQPPDGAAKTTEVRMFQIRNGDQEQLFRRPAILRGLTGDLYIAPQELHWPEGEYTVLDLRLGEPAALGEATVTFLRFERGEPVPPAALTVLAFLHLRRGEEEETVVLPYSMVNEVLRGTPVPIASIPETRLAILGMAVEEGSIRVAVDSPKNRPRPVLLVEMSTKPLIGSLWAGTILLSLGCGMAAARRFTEESQMAAVAPRLAPSRIAERKTAAAGWRARKPRNRRRTAV